tara:strand:+ start:475 stop:807 length:333 start_codon:yes stop_codon:yes gene_type:complete
MKEEKEKIESMGLNPTVTLVITDEFGKVKLLEKVGETNLSGFLKLASKIDDNPITEDSYLLDCRGQEIYTLDNFDYFKSITGVFLACPDSDQISKLCKSKDLKFSFIVSY